jgi:hypothetical protein
MLKHVSKQSTDYSAVSHISGESGLRITSTSSPLSLIGRLRSKALSHCPSGRRSAEWQRSGCRGDEVPTKEIVLSSWSGSPRKPPAASRRACKLRMRQPLICGLPMKPDNRRPATRRRQSIPVRMCVILPGVAPKSHRATRNGRLLDCLAVSIFGATGC